MSSGRGQGGELTEAEAKGVGALVKERKKREVKRSSVRKPKPLQQQSSGGTRFRQAWTKTAGELTEADQRRAVEQALEVFSQLPAQSSYARHRIKVLHQALQLLDKAA